MKITSKLIVSVVFLALTFNACSHSKSDNAESQDAKSEQKENAGSQNEASPSAETNWEKVAVTDSLSDGKITVIDFYATWCAPCKELAPYFEKWAYSYSRDVNFKKVDIDRDQMMADENEIEAVPTIIIYAPDGREISRTVGFDPAGIESKIKDAISNYR